MTSTKLRDIKNDHLKPSSVVANQVTPPPQDISSEHHSSEPLSINYQTNQNDFLSSIAPVHSGLDGKKPFNKNNIIIILVIFCTILLGGSLILFNQNKSIKNEYYAQDAAEDAQISAEEAVVAASEAIVAAPVEDAMEVNQGEEQGSVDAPLLTQGSSWNYKVIDYVNPKNSFDNVSLNINQVTADGYIFEKEWVGSKRDIAYLDYDNHLNPRAGATGSYEPSLSYYDFPLVPGKTWNTTSKVLNHKYGMRDEMNFSGKVIGWEQISSPAWENVNALRIEVEIVSYKEGVIVSKELDVSWYEPEVGRAIKTLEYQWNDVTQSFGSPIRQQYVFTYNRR
jgi:hypothetical protein